LPLVVLSHAVQHFYVGGLALTYPLVVSAFHVSYGVLGAVLTAAGLAGGLLQGAAGLVRRLSARLVLGLQDVGLGLASLLGALAPGFAVFGAARLLGALVSWPQHPVGSAYVAERFPRRRGAVLSWHTAGGSLGTVVVPLLASSVIAAAGWRWALVAIAVPMGLGGAVVLALLPADRHRSDAVATGAPQPGHPPRSLRRLLGTRRVQLVLAASTVAAGGRGLGTISAYVPAYLRSGLHLGPLEVGVVFTVVMAASVAGPVLAGHLADRLGRHRLLVVAYLAGAPALVGFVMAGAELAGLLAAAVAVGVLAYAESPLLQAVFSDAAEGADHRVSFGAFFAIAYGVGSLWLALLGWIIDAAGFRAAFTVMAGSFLLAAALVALAGRARGGGLEPPITGPEPVVLPITPPPNGSGRG
jgi:MFS family permease